MDNGITLILGGARSGKSAFAERLAAHAGRPVCYVATATAGDAEMTERIAAHRAARPADWRTIEAPDGLADAVRSHACPGDLVLIDCLTLWVSNVIMRRLTAAGHPEDLSAHEWTTVETELLAAVDDLLGTVPAVGASLILVSNEVGLGLVPPYPIGRRYRDVLGRVNRAVAYRADAVLLMIAGLPVDVRRLVAPEFRAILGLPEVAPEDAQSTPG